MYFTDVLREYDYYFFICLLYWIVNIEKRKTMRSHNRFHNYVPSLLLFLLFEAVAVTLWLTKDNLFYLLNFSYIGACLALGTALFTAGKRYARHFVK